MADKVTIIKNARLVDAEEDFAGAIAFSAQGILAVEEAAESEKEPLLTACYPDADVVDAAGKTVMPAFVDMHVHFRYPGQTAKEDLLSGSRAAAAGGVGTVVLMPNTTPVVSTLEMAEDINRQIKEAGFTDSFQTVSITSGFSGTDISHLDEVCAAYPAVPVITEDGKDVASADVMLQAMKKCAEKGIIVSCHCEAPDLVPEAKKLRTEKRFRQAEAVLARAEDTFTERNIQLALEAGCRIHIAHASTAAALEAVRKAKETEAGRKLVTCEVTPHHMALSCETDEMNAELVNPPLRSEKDRQAVIKAMLDGTADVISTDHAPHTAEDKAGGACGFTGIELSFTVSNTTLVTSGLMDMKKLSSLMSAEPARLLGMKKGRLIPEYGADLVLVDPEQEFTVDPAAFASKGKYTPFNGRKLRGKVLKTWHAGRLVYDER